MRINTLLKSAQNNEDERLVYLRKNLANFDKVKAIKALRERYPELGLVEAKELWEQSQSNTNLWNKKPLTKKREVSYDTSLF